MIYAVRVCLPTALLGSWEVNSCPVHMLCVPIDLQHQSIASGLCECGFNQDMHEADSIGGCKVGLHAAAFFGCMIIVAVLAFILSLRMAHVLLCARFNRVLRVDSLAFSGLVMMISAFFAATARINRAMMTLEFHRQAFEKFERNVKVSQMLSGALFLAALTAFAFTLVNAMKRAEMPVPNLLTFKLRSFLVFGAPVTCAVIAMTLILRHVLPDVVGIMSTIGSVYVFTVMWFQYSRFRKGWTAQGFYESNRMKAEAIVWELDRAFWHMSRLIWIYIVLGILFNISYYAGRHLQSQTLMSKCVAIATILQAFSYLWAYFVIVRTVSTLFQLRTQQLFFIPALAAIIDDID
jgi:hypothetical protein